MLFIWILECDCRGVGIGQSSSLMNLIKGPGTKPDFGIPFISLKLLVYQKSTEDEILKNCGSTRRKHFWKVIKMLDQDQWGPWIPEFDSMRYITYRMYDYLHCRSVPSIIFSESADIIKDLPFFKCQLIVLISSTGVNCSGSCSSWISSKFKDRLQTE